MFARHARLRTVAKLDRYDRPGEMLSQPFLPRGIIVDEPIKPTDHGRAAGWARSSGTDLFGDATAPGDRSGMIRLRSGWNDIACDGIRGSCPELAVAGIGGLEGARDRATRAATPLVSAEVSVVRSLTYPSKLNKPCDGFAPEHDAFSSRMTVYRRTLRIDAFDRPDTVAHPLRRSSSASA